MAVNEYMHPRNKYREKINFTELASRYPELMEVANVNFAGNIKLDFKNAKTLQLLTKCLLQQDFGLHVELPADKLCPTLPLRLNYICWVEDMVNTFDWGKSEAVSGIDIGCGASCIFPLLGVVHSNRKWQMIGLEKSEGSVDYAQKNVNANGLQKWITVKRQEENSILIDCLKQLPNKQFNFCMCNPPFYNISGCDNYENRTGRRRKSSNVRTGSCEELETEGGELQFVKQIIKESLVLKDRILVYTTMLGRKRSFEEILHTLKAHSIANVTVTRFCQGKIIRWAVAWTFDDNVVLSRVPDLSVQRSIGSTIGPCKLLEWKMFSLQEQVNVCDVKSTLESILTPIFVHLKEFSRKTEEIMMYLMADSNTWSHQRKKNRKLKTLLSPPSENNLNEKLEKTNHTVLEDVPAKRLKVALASGTYLKASIRIQRRNDGYYLSLHYLSGTGGKDSINQILQYVKNECSKIT